jgi:hypothetical protein
MVTKVGYPVAERSRGRVTLCAVCIVHKETRKAILLVEPQNHGRRFVSGLVSKPLGQFLPIWTQNWWCGFLGLALKPRSTVSPGLTSKLVATGFPVWASKPAATV